MASSAGKRLKLSPGATGQVTPPLPSVELAVLKTRAEVRWQQNMDTLERMRDPEKRVILIRTPAEAHVFLEHVASYINSQMYDLRSHFVEGHHLLECLLAQHLGLEKIRGSATATDFCQDFRKVVLPWWRSYSHVLPWAEHEKELSPATISAISNIDSISTEGVEEVDFREVTRNVGLWRDSILKVGAFANEHHRVSKKCGPQLSIILDSPKAQQEFPVSREFLKPIVGQVENCLFSQKTIYRRIMNKLDDYLEILTKSETSQNGGTNSGLEQLAKAVWTTAFGKVKRSSTDLAKRASGAQKEVGRELVSLSYVTLLENAIEAAAAGLSRNPAADVQEARDESARFGQRRSWSPPRP